MARPDTSQTFTCSDCGNRYFRHFEMACDANGQHPQCEGCVLAFMALWTGDIVDLDGVKNPAFHIAAVEHKLPDGFRCGFCAGWRTWEDHGFNDGGIMHCAQCTDALDALMDGSDDALRILRVII